MLDNGIVTTTKLRRYLERVKAQVCDLEELHAGEHIKDPDNRYWVKLPCYRAGVPIGKTAEGETLYAEDNMTNYVVLSKDGEGDLVKIDDTGVMLLMPMSGIYRNLLDRLGYTPDRGTQNRPRFLRAALG